MRGPRQANHCVHKNSVATTPVSPRVRSPLLLIEHPVMSACSARLSLPNRLFAYKTSPTSRARSSSSPALAIGIGKETARVRPPFLSSWAVSTVVEYSGSPRPRRKSLHRRTKPSAGGRHDPPAQTRDGQRSRLSEPRSGRLEGCQNGCT